jgi:uncharacterized protein (DUF924 family)
MKSSPRRVLDSWLGEAEASARGLNAKFADWFGGGGPEAQRRRDDEIRSEFGADVARASRGELDDWAATPLGRLALVILLDQFPRNIYRGRPEAFALDTKALALTREGIRLGTDRELSPLQRFFFYMPLQHAEDLDVQEESVRQFESLLQDAPAELRAVLEGGVRYATLHRDILRQFGRFPHRNAILGRASTPAEQAYLAGNAPDFGQASGPSR